MVKKKVIKKEENKILGMKKNTILTIGALIIVVVLLNNNGILTGEVSKGQIFEKQLTNYLRYDPINNIPGKVFDGLHMVYFYGVTANDAALITVDCILNPDDPLDSCIPRRAYWGGCSANDVGTFIGNGISNAYGIPCGVTVRVCSASYDRQEVDLDLIPEAC